MTGTEMRCHLCSFVIDDSAFYELDDFGWRHALCSYAYQEDVAADRAHDQRRERGL